jgi:hypothetical protein
LAKVITEIDTAGGATIGAVRGAFEDLGCKSGFAEDGGVPLGLLFWAAETVWAELRDCPI